MSVFQDASTCESAASLIKHINALMKSDVAGAIHPETQTVAG